MKIGEVTPPSPANPSLRWNDDKQAIYANHSRSLYLKIRLTLERVLGHVSYYIDSGSTGFEATWSMPRRAQSKWQTSPKSRQKGDR